MSDRACAAPRPWLLAAKVASGPWRALVYLWTYGPHWKPDDPLPETGTVHVWPFKSTIARDLGKPQGTVNGWLKGLSRTGWIQRQGNVWALAVEMPIQEWIDAWSESNAHPDADETHPKGAGSSPGELSPAGGETSPPPGEVSPGGEANSRPQILHVSSSDPPSDPPFCETAQTYANDGEIFSLTPPSYDPPSKPKSKTTIEVETIRALHEELAIAAFRHHHLDNPKAKRPKGTLPAPSTKAGKTLDNRIKSAIKDHGIERCEQAIRWRYKDWLVNKKQLAWGPETVWSEGSLGFIFGRIDIGEDPKGAKPERIVAGMGAAATFQRTLDTAHLTGVRVITECSDFD